MNGDANGAPEGAGDGGGDGGGDGEQPAKKPKILDFLAFCDAIAGKEAELQPLVSVCEADANGRGGELLAKVELYPTETLDDRIKEKIDGPLLVFLRTRKVTGQWSLCGRFKVPKSRASSSSADPTVALLLEQNRQLMQELKEERTARIAATAAAAVPVETAKDKVGTLGELVDIVDRMKPKEPAAPAPAAATPPAPKSLAEQWKEFKEAAHELGFVKSTAAEKAESLVSKSLDTFGDSINGFIQTITAGVARKMDKDEGES